MQNNCLRERNCKKPIAFQDHIHFILRLFRAKNKLENPPLKVEIKKTRTIKFGFLIEVGLLGLEPRLFCTKNRRVASYTIGQHFNSDANLEQTLFYANIFRLFYYLIFQALKSVFFYKKIVVLNAVIKSFL